MNVIVSNKYQSLLGTLDIDVLKSINGEFTPEELAANFTNFFYNKLILDITAIKNYKDISVIQSLASIFDMSKVILMLDDSEVVNSPTYMSQLVSMGIYNFAKNLDSIKFLIDNPNTYKDVASYHQLNNFGDPKAKDVMVNPEISSKLESQRIIGVKNVTEHAGATTLVYMLKKELEDIYKVKAVELDNHDFTFLNDKSLDSIASSDFATYINDNVDKEVIFADLNGSGMESSCTDVIYLIEPGLIKLNKLIRNDREIFEKLKNKKIVLNRSVLNTKDVIDFEYESKSKIFYNLPFLDDKKDHQRNLNDFLLALGFSRLNGSGDKSKLFNIFK